MSTRRHVQRIHDDWRRVRPDLDPTPMRRLILLNLTARLALDQIERTQQTHGLNLAQADLLLTLYRSAPDQGLTPGELTNLIAITPASITNRLDRLEHDNLIARTPDPHDARARRVRLTSEGRARVEALLPDHLGNEERMLAGLTDAEHADLERLLLKLAGHLEDLTP